MAKAPGKTTRTAGTTKKKKTKKAAPSAKASKPRATSSRSRKSPVPETTGKQLVIVESPTKAKTINKYLGPDYVVMASVGHVRDLPGRNPKGVKNPVPGVDLEQNFEPTYEVLADKKGTVGDLKKAAKKAAEVWFATDLDREGEAIAWHLAEAIGVPVDQSKRVVFNAITRTEIQQAFSHPRSIDTNRVNAQQARRVLDRIVGYQVSPLLWKKVAGGLSAGRVQSVAVRLVVEREREIDAFNPDEYWKIAGYFTTDLAGAGPLTDALHKWLAEQPDGKPRTMRERVAWLGENKGLRAELVEFSGKPVEPTNAEQALKLAAALGFQADETKQWEDPKAKGAAKNRVRLIGGLSEPPRYTVKSLQTKRVKSRPSAPFITGTLQQAAANQLGFTLKRTMRVAQQLYEGIDVHGDEGQTGLITYMRTDSTNLSGEAIQMARSYIGSEWGNEYLPDKAKVYTTKNKAAQEAHEAIRPTDARLTPKRVKSSLSDEQYRLYRLIWERFLACQMADAQWDSTTVLIATDPGDAVLKATGRTLAFDGFYKATGVPNAGEEAILPPLEEKQQLAPLQIDPTQHFTSPPPRYTEASLQKKLETEGIGRPSTYAPIIQTIQDRKYVEQVAPRDRRLRATDLGMVVTDKLVEGFPRIMDIAYTRYMETELDKIEEEHHDWVTMLRDFYGPFKQNLDTAHETMTHAKAETQPAPHKCEKCDATTVYRFGRNGRFLSCSRYPDCDYASPIDREGNPVKAQVSDIACPLCSGAMTKRTGRFGPFLGCENYPECKGILKLDPKKATVVLPKPPPMLTDLQCSKCESPMNLRRSKRGPWLSCSAFPKCRGRMGWTTLEAAEQKKLEDALAKHEEAHPLPVVKTTAGRVVEEGYAPVIESDAAEPGDPQTDQTDSDAA